MVACTKSIFTYVPPVLSEPLVEVLCPCDSIHFQFLHGVVGLGFVDIPELTELVLVWLVALPVRIELE